MKRAITFILCLAITACSAQAGVADTLRSNGPVSFEQESINLAKMVGDSDVLLIGDDHTQFAIKNFLRDHLQELQALGFRCLALEMLPIRLQAELDRWNETDQEHIRQHLVRFWGEKGAGIPESLFRLISAAKHEGLMVTALDPDTSLMTDRDTVNPAWVECVHRCMIGKDGNRMIVFGGSGHFESKPGSAFSLLRAQGIRASTIEFAGLETPESLGLDLKTRELLGQPIPFRLQVADESRRLGLPGPFMVCAVADKILPPVSRWVIKLDPESPQLAYNPVAQ